MPECAPGRVLVAGDWHGSTDWAVGVIRQVPTLLAGEQRRVLLHAGDFGVWPGRAGADYLEAVSGALRDVAAELWFVDGNHEDHDRLRTLLRNVGGDRSHPIPVADRVWWLPRGYRWTWHGRAWVAAGGAVSVDSLIRTAGRDWWPGESLSPMDCEAITAPGPADVVLAHDCPSSVPLKLGTPPRWWDVKSGDKHRDTVQDVCDQLRPSHWIHGHYHQSHRTTGHMYHGDVDVVGLDCDGATRGNYRVIDTRTMEWDAA